MKILFFVLASLCLCQIKEKIINQLLLSFNDIDLFEAYIYIYNKTYYLGSDEYNSKFNNFKNSIEFIKSKNSSFTSFAINNDSDLSTEEFKSIKLNYKSPIKALFNISAHEIIKPDDLCVHIDWRPFLNKAQNQETCGSCWAFSTLSSIEAQLKKTFNSSEYLSTQELIDCSDNYGCDGGFPHKALDYIIKYGITLDKHYPYSKKKQACQQKFNKFFIKDYTFCNTIPGILPTQSCDFATIVNMLNTGPLIALIDAGSMSFRHYSKGLLKLDQSDCQEINHAVTIVGFKNNNFIVRNSWGEQWGDHGYFYIPFDKSPKSMCFLTSSLILPILHN